MEYQTAKKESTKKPQVIRTLYQYKSLTEITSKIWYRINTNIKTKQKQSPPIVVGGENKHEFIALLILILKKYPVHCVNTYVQRCPTARIVAFIHRWPSTNVLHVLTMYQNGCSSWRQRRWDLRSCSCNSWRISFHE